MMKKVLNVLTIVSLMVGVLVVSCGQNTEAEIDETEIVVVDDNTTSINVTMYDDCYDTTQFVGTPRVEQMFVTNVEYTDDEMYNVVTLEDTTGNVWEYEGIDLYMYDEVLVFMADNNTPNDVTDDVIIHFWVGLE